MTNYVFIGFFVIFVVLYYVLINISTNASTPSTAIGTIQPCFATGKAQSVTSHLTATSHYFQRRFLSNIHVTLQGQDSSLPFTAFQPILFVDADVEQALISLSILAPEGKHGGYGTWQLVTSEQGFHAAQNVYWWLPTDERSATSVCLVCHPP